MRNRRTMRRNPLNCGVGVREQIRRMDYQSMVTNAQIIAQEAINEGIVFIEDKLVELAERNPRYEMYWIADQLDGQGLADPKVQQHYNQVMDSVEKQLKELYTEILLANLDYNL